MTRHSSSNGKGKTEPPVPQEGTPQQMEVPIAKTITQPSKMTTAEKDDAGRLHISFVLIEAGQAVEYVYIVEEGGQENIKEAMSPGLATATLLDVPAAAAAAKKE